MPKEIYPCLWFDNQAHAAAAFYCSIFNNSKITTDTPMVVMFELNGKKIMGLNGGPIYKMNPSVSMFMHSTSKEECDRIWAGLKDGANILMDMGSYPWSEHYGWLEDKFGFSWQIMKGEADKMMPALLFTGPQMGKGEAALEFYTTLFDNSSVNFKSYYPEGSPFEGNISYAEFNLNGYPLIGMDGPNEHQFTFSEGISFVLNCDTQEEIDFYWDKFSSDGGEESRCGWCKDKFGISWQIIPSNLNKLMSDPEKGQRVMKELLKMNKLEMSILENA